MHSDHTDYISFLHEDIPIYMGETCHSILQALEERSPRIIEREILTYKPRPYNAKDNPIARKIETFRTGDKFRIGPSIPYGFESHSPRWILDSNPIFYRIHEVLRWIKNIFPYNLIEL